MGMLCFFIPLDIFKESLRNKGIQNRLDGWLTFLSSDAPEDICALLDRYPDFRDLYEHVYQICRNMENIMGIFSEELLQMDRNTVQPRQKHCLGEGMKLAVLFIGIHELKSAYPETLSETPHILF